ncbi:MAG: hypothetical protein AAF969_13685 [Bacteroidota bacterium]
MKYKYLFIGSLILLLGCGERSREQDTNINSEAATINQWINTARDSTQLDLNHRKAYLKRATEMAFTVTLPSPKQQL